VFLHPISRPTIPLRSATSSNKKNTLTRLSLHRPNASILEEQPIVHLIPLPRALRKADLVLRIVALYQVLHDASGLEEVDGLAVGEGVG